MHFFRGEIFKEIKGRGNCNESCQNNSQYCQQAYLISLKYANFSPFAYYDAFLALFCRLNKAFASCVWTLKHTELFSVKVHTVSWKIHGKWELR